MKPSVSAAITPLVLTYNEAPNIGRTLASLQWAERVVVLDSGSTDETEGIAKSFSNTDWQVRPFDNHGAQWEYGVRGTGISSKFVLALDADMIVPERFVIELADVFLAGNYEGGMTPFEYHILGHALYGSVYPTQLRIFKPEQVQVSQSGHTQEFSIDAPAYYFKTRLIHDDRKSLERWTSSQLSYSTLEARRVAADRKLRWRDRLRAMGLMPLVAGALAYLRAGGPFYGAVAARYAYERAAYECLLGIRLMSDRIQNERDGERESHKIKRQIANCKGDSEKLF
jgi:glycosyltransferase involved in cell wall biosynthesis